MLNILNPRNKTANCSALFFLSLSRFESTQLDSTRLYSTQHTRRDVRREWGRRKACVNLIVEIKVDTYDDFANSL